MKDIIVYILDNEVNVIYKDKVIRQKFESVSKGFIINKDNFIQEFWKLVKKEKIKSKILGDKIVIIKNAFYRLSDLVFLEGIFQDLGFLKVSFLDIRELLEDKSASYIEVNLEYMVVYLEEGVYLDLRYFLDIPKIMNYFGGRLKENVILFGTNKNISKIKIRDKNVYYIDCSDKFIVESLLKVKKCDA